MGDNCMHACIFGYNDNTFCVFATTHIYVSFSLLFHCLFVVGLGYHFLALEFR